MRLSWTLALLILVSGGCSSRPEVRIIGDLASALGGRGDVEDVDTLLIEGEGESFWLGEGRNPDPDRGLPRFTSTFTRAFDWTNRRYRMEEQRTPAFTTPTGVTGWRSTQRFIEALDANLAFNIDAFDKAARLPDRYVTERHAILRHHPIGLIRAALDPGATVGMPREENGRTVVEITTPDGAELTLFVDPETSLPTRVESATYDYNWGDITIGSGFGDYQSVDGLMLPTRITSTVESWTVADFRVTAQTVNGDVGRLEAPRLIREASTDPPAIVATAEELADGVWYVTTGRDLYSLVVEFEDHLTLINTPFGDNHTLAIIAQARALRPDKPLTEAVITHHHVEHAGGIRAAVSEGLTLIVQAGSRVFYEEMVSRAHTSEPDALARNPKPLDIQTVDDHMRLEDAARTRTLDLYHVTGTEYVDGMLMAVLPAERLLYEADLYSPPADPLARRYPEYPFASDLTEEIASRGLEVERVAPAQGRVVPFAELEKAARPPFEPGVTEPEEPPGA